MIDDAHLWEKGWDNTGPARDAVAGLAALIEEQVPGLGIVVATDVDDERGRGYIDGVATAAKIKRRGVLLQPDLSDGSLFSTMLPSATVEPTTGIGRGIYCHHGAMQEHTLIYLAIGRWPGIVIGPP